VSENANVEKGRERTEGYRICGSPQRRLTDQGGGEKAAEVVEAREGIELDVDAILRTRLRIAAELKALRVQFTFSEVEKTPRGNRRLTKSEGFGSGEKPWGVM
jgi:hypothetical protein